MFLLSDFSRERVEFRRSKHLSAAHKRKISQALKGRNPPTLKGHVVKGGKIGAGIYGSMGAINGALGGGLVGGPLGVPVGAAIGGASGALGGGLYGAGAGAGVYGIRRGLARRRDR